jgi:Na+/proline symporter
MDWTWISVYLVGAIVLTWVAQRRSRSSVSDFFGGGQHLSWGLVGLSMVATTFSADTPLAVTGIIREHGISGNWLWWNMVLGGTLTTFLFARSWRRAGILTDLEFIEFRYSDRWAGPLRRIKAVWYGLFINGLILAWVNVAMLTVLEVYFAIDRSTAFIILSALVVITTTTVWFGGLRGVVYLDTYQFVLALSGAIVLAIWVVDKPQVGGLDGIREKLKHSGALNFLPQVGSSPANGSLVIGWGQLIAFLGLQWWASWYPGAEPGGGGYIAQRMLSTKNEGGALKSMLLFQFLHYAVRPWPWILVGLSCLILYPEIQSGGSGYVRAMCDVLPAGLGGLMLVGFGSAYMSTLSTHLNWGASYLVNDWLGLVYPKLRSNLLLSRTLVVALGVIGICGALVVDRVESVWLFLIECGAGVGSVLILRWFWWRVTAAAELVATILPFFFFGIQQVIHFQVESGSKTGFFVFPNTYFITVTGTIIGWLLVVWLGPKPKSSCIESFDQQVRPMGWWPTKRDGRNKKLGGLLVAWLVAAVSILGVLLSLGQFLVGGWMAGLVCLGISISGLITLFALNKKYEIFSDTESQDLT